MKLPYLKILRVCFILAIIVSLGFFASATDFNKTLENIRQIGLGFPLLLLITIFAYAFGTLGWKLCLKTGSGEVSFMQLFMIRHICEMVSLFNPASIVGGDLLKIRLLKRYGIPKDRVVDSVLVSRALMIFSHLVLLIIALAWLSFSSANYIIWPVWNILALIAGIIAFGWFAYYILNRLSGRRFAYVFASIKGFYTEQQRAFVLSFLCFILHWIAGSLEFYAIMRLLGFDISVVQGLLLDMGVVVIKSLGAFIPGQLGIEEIGNKLMLGVIGLISSSVWLSVSILRRARQVIWLLIGGLFYLIVYHQVPERWKSYS